MKYPYPVDVHTRMSSLKCMKIATCAICLSFVLVAVFRVLNDIHEIRDYEELLSTTLVQQLHNFPQDDELVISRLRALLVLPAKEAYRLTNPLPEEHVLAREVRKIYQLKRGFFLEIGAGDGEYRSPTLCLEAEDGWSGMLIEADPLLGASLKQKKRKAIVAIGCVGSSNFSYVGFLWKERVMPQDWEIPENYSEEDMEELETSCFPLRSYLEAADVREVDFLTVNINGDELGVLETVPWGRVPVKIVAVAVLDPDKVDEIKSYMASIGFSYRSLLAHLGESFLLFIAKQLSPQ